MQALRLHAIGGPEQLRIDTIDAPELGDADVLVRVRAAALNHRDVFITQGLYPKVALPVTLGSDGAGEVAVCGSTAARRWNPGDEVVIDPMLDWGPDPNVWDERRSSILGMPRDGTFAQYVAVPASNLYRKPAMLSWEEAAAIPLAGLTAFRALFTRGNLQHGETVLVPGVGGGVQTFVLLFAKAAGARTIVTSSTAEKLERARALGADLALNYRTEPDWHKALRSEKIDLVVDSSGGDTLRKALDAVRPGGRIVVYGGTVGDATLKLFPLFWKHVSILGTSMGSPDDFASVLRLFGGSLRPAIDRVFALHDGVAAFHRLDSAEQFGKVVLTLESVP
ncbi:MAG: zinc-binding dehydrogenase [Candidatus Eremiobacteraeota bacterium]|nr:zinc-binding dehydrogenase [Candidatus Eremiobacteraeota bacterium]